MKPNELIDDAKASGWRDSLIDLQNYRAECCD